MIIDPNEIKARLGHHGTGEGGEPEGGPEFFPALNRGDGLTHVLTCQRHPLVTHLSPVLPPCHQGPGDHNPGHMQTSHVKPIPEFSTTRVLGKDFGIGRGEETSSLGGMRATSRPVLHSADWREESRR